MAPRMLLSSREIKFMRCVNGIEEILGTYICETTQKVKSLVNKHVVFDHAETGGDPSP
jgi:hypothetical protein